MGFLKIASILLFNFWVISLSHGKTVKRSTPTLAALGEFPHMVAIGYEQDDEIRYNCLGALISPKFILTTGHCGSKTIPKVVLLGNLDSAVEGAESQKISVKTIHIHPDYTPMKQYNDISIIELEHPAKIDKNVEPACISDKSEVDINTLIGSGVNFPRGGAKFGPLKKYSLPDSTCDTYPSSRRLPNGLADYHFCVTTDQEMVSGSVIQVASKSGPCKYDVYGFVTFGRRTDEVYTKTSSFYD